MNLSIHRGSKQIGGSCVEVTCQGKRLLIDFGLPLDAEEETGNYLPNTAGLDGSDPSLMGILISHPHLDHFCGAPSSPRELLCFYFVGT